MKINIITIHCIPNFGSVFQTLALYKYTSMLNKKINVNVIDYNPNYFKPRSVRSILGMLLNIKTYINRKKKFDSFVKKHICLTPRSYKNIDELKNEHFDADLFISGGDQLWNVYHDCGHDDAYKLTFVNGKKISYATSLGQCDFTQKQLEDLASKISCYSHVSVRESSSVSLLSSVGIKVTHCVDPVFLLSPNDYLQYIRPVKHKQYLLVYLVTPSKLLEDVITKLSAKYNLQVILCSGFSKKCTCDVFLKDLGPEEILSYIYHADMVLSSSFHATSFSMIFKKQFYTILPHPNTNERILDILSIRGLSERVISLDSDLDIELSKQIDYSSVSDYNDYINASKSYLEKALDYEFAR